MYYLTVGAVFKNESWNMKEWLEHHLFHGVEHFYLINDNSTDNYMSVLQSYIDKGLVTLYHNDVVKEGVDDSRQGRIYGKYLTPHLKDCFWIAIIDLDEFLWSPHEIDVRKILKNYEEYGSVEVNWLLFGTNGYDRHPESLVKCLTRRGLEAVKIWIKMPQEERVPDHWDFPTKDNRRYYLNHCFGPKNILNTQWVDPSGFGIHSHKTTKPKINASYQIHGSNPPLLINHYYCQSRQAWREIKMLRGSCGDVEDNYRGWDVFENSNVNDVEDTRLREQNRPLFET